MRASGWNQQEMAEHFGVSQPTVNRWLSGSEPRGTVRDAINAKFSELSETSSPALEINPSSEKFTLIPEFGVHVSAGGGALVNEESETAKWPFNPDYVSNVLGMANANLAIVEVRGDSMEPTLMSGDRVMVNMSDKQISQSGIFVIYDGDGTVVKRVDKRIGDDETVTIISDNTIHERYQVPISYLNVIGRVVWVARRL